MQDLLERDRGERNLPEQIKSIASFSPPSIEAGLAASR